ncbi:MAG: type II toxin-antitoxin system HipA family toxin YjjJ [Aquabacterium sp.]
MRPRNQPARDRLQAVLRRLGPASAPALAAELGVSRATLHRMLVEAGTGQIVSAGQAQRSRHAMRRPLRGGAGDIPLRRVDAAGRVHDESMLALKQPSGSRLVLSAGRWPLPDSARDGWWDGLPYPLYDMAPQGWLGRQFARARHLDLGVADDPRRWSDDDVVHVLASDGVDGTGDLILGDVALERWMRRQDGAPDPLPVRGIGRAYVRLADQAIADGVPGSSAAGEFPKFTALRERPGMATPHVIVKFSGAGGSAAERRWAALLRCEHLALQAAASIPGITAPASHIVESGGRTFLEVERFDRIGLHGRLPLVSLAALEPALLGLASPDWRGAADALERLGWLSHEDAQAVHRLWWFGRLINNTDMHPGNLSFIPGRPLKLAPVYDMLPMRWAPMRGGEVPDWQVVAPEFLLGAGDVPGSVIAAAKSFWSLAAGMLRAH